MKVEETLCPQCGAGPGTLSITIKLVLKPLGTFSLAGAQMKASAYEAPILECSECDLSLEGHR